MEKQDWADLAVMVENGEAVEREKGRVSFRLPGHGFTVRCQDDAPARKSLAEKLRKTAKSPPAPKRLATAGARETYQYAKGHPDIAKHARFSWVVVKDLLTPDSKALGGDLRDYKARIGNALEYMARFNVEPVLTAAQQRTATDPPAEILIDPKPVNFTAENGDVLTLYVGQFIRPHGRVEWGNVQNETGGCVGPRARSQRVVIDRAREKIERLPSLGPAREKAQNTPDEQKPTGRLQALREWLGTV